LRECEALISDKQELTS